MQVSTCEVAFDIRCDQTCWETRVDVFVSPVARVKMFVGAVALHLCEKPMLDSTIAIGPCMTVCLYGNYAADGN